MHRYVETLPREILPRIDELRYADEVLGPIRSAFPGSALTPLPMTGEIYVSRYNYDRGGDQGLFDRHYDGNLRFLPGGSVVRSLIYLSADDRLEVVFDTSGTQANMRTYTFGLLDFHGTLPHADVARPLASADVFVFPSCTDTAGNVVLEAQACGLPRSGVRPGRTAGEPAARRVRAGLPRRAGGGPRRRHRRAGVEPRAAARKWPARRGATP